ncbi:MAG: TIM barrel protein [Desulfurococcaceae archaeon]|jgi:deoxyribonuclease-4|nr:TIM barrel protein [Desulfurococcaceae archaeon]
MPRYWFGPAGKPITLKSADILRAPSFLREMGLNAMEYEAVRGVNIREDKAKALGDEARANGIKLSLHAPYYVNLAGRRDVVERSIRNLNESIEASHWMGAYVVVFHPGYYKDAPSKKDALRKVIESLKPVSEYRDQIGAKEVWLGPETTGKTSQVGDLEEVIEITIKVEGTRPVIDFAHLYARSGGKFITSREHVLEVVDLIEKKLGSWALRPLHVHFSKIEYSKGGEKEHHTLSEEAYGPDFKHVCSVLCEVGVDAVIISESPVLEQDAVIMLNMCREICGEKCIVEQTTD